MTLQQLRESGWIVYEYIRGSKLHNIDTEHSDTDIGGVFILPQKYLLGLQSSYISQVSDEKSDIVFYELGTWINLLLKSNPNAIESLFIPEDKIIYKDKCLNTIFENRNKFLSKTIFKHISGYAYSQIQKARGLNKKIVNPIVKRLDVLDFCRVLINGGCVPLKAFLADKNLDQKNCGVVDINGTKGCYAVYYDYGENLGYKGIANENSNEVKLSSIPKYRNPLFYMFFNADAYSVHCRQYKEYKDWEKHRNPVRYESNLNQNYDAKNMCECLRILKTGINFIKTGEFNPVCDDNTRSFLLDVRSHKYEYSKALTIAEKYKTEMENLLECCNLPEEVDKAFVENILISIRKCVNFE